MQFYKNPKKKLEFFFLFFFEEIFLKIKNFRKNDAILHPKLEKLKTKSSFADVISTFERF